MAHIGLGAVVRRQNLKEGRIRHRASREAQCVVRANAAADDLMKVII